MSYIRCYHCGTGCSGGSLVRVPMRTGGGVGWSNVCHSCAKAHRSLAAKAAQERARQARRRVVMTAAFSTTVFIAPLVGFLWWVLSK
jgi:hypothetical protein